MASGPPELVKHRPRYDLSMSRRTRKPKVVAELVPSPDQDDDDDARRSSSLKELMNESTGAGADDDQELEGGHAKGSGSSLALVMRKQGGDGGAGAVKMGRMVSKCVKVLSHLVKAKRDSKKKSAVPQLKP